MGLSSDLISKFVKSTKDETPVKPDTIVYGTVQLTNGKLAIQLDGASTSIPIEESTIDTREVNVGNRVMVLIKNHKACIIGNLTSQSVTVNGIQSDLGRIDKLELDNIDIHNTLTAQEGVMGELSADYGEFKETTAYRLWASEAEITDLKAGFISAEQTAAKYATIDGIKATNGDIYNLKTIYASAERMTVAEGDIEELESKYVEVTGRLDAAEADIDNLEANVADIDTLIYGSASGKTMHVDFANAIIALLGDAWIKSAMIESVSADKITASEVNVVSDDGSLVISDETIQVSDDTRVRVQIGKDASDDYSINVWDQNGALMFSKGGITDAAIKDAIIRDEMVSNTANISAHKLNIDSLFEEINNSSKTIKSSKIYLDEEKQTLDVAFGSLESAVTEQGETISAQGTDISVIKGKIDSKVWQQDINSATNTMSSKYSSLEQEVDGISATVASHTTQISKKADSSAVTEVNTKVSELRASLDGFKTTVSETYATNEDLDTISIGGRNLLTDSDDGYSFTGKSFSNSTHSGTKVTCTVEGGKADHYCMVTEHVAPTPEELSKEDGLEFTFSADVKIVGSIQNPHMTFDLRNGETHTKVLMIRAYADPSVTDRWQRIYGTGVISGDSDGVNRALVALLYNSATLDSTIEYRRVKLERGNKATDWTPAPEDTDNVLKNLEDRVYNAETTIDQNSEAILARATKTEVTTAKSEAISEANDNTASLLKNYSTTEEMTAAIQLKADGITSSVRSTYATISSLNDTNANVTAAQESADKAQSDIDDLSIGGRNYAALSMLKRYHGGILYDPLSYWLIDETKISAVGQPTSGPMPGFKIEHSGESSYVISGRTDLETFKSYHKCFDVNDAEVKAQTLVYVKPTNGLFELRFTVPDTTAYIHVGVGSDAVGDYYIDKLKIERGTKPTDWTPAPEDMGTAQDTERAQSTANNALDTATNAETLIQQLSDSISMLVTDGNGTSLMTQTEDGWTFSTAHIQELVNKTSEDLSSLTDEFDDIDSAVGILQQAVEDLGATSEYIRIGTYEGEPCIELGENDSDFKLIITNTRIMFMEGTSAPAYISNKSLHITKAVIEEELQQGSFVWKVRANGNMGLMWKGGV